MAHEQRHAYGPSPLLFPFRSISSYTVYVYLLMTPRSSVVSRHTTIHEYMDDTSTSVCIRGFVRHATLDGE